MQTTPTVESLWKAPYEIAKHLNFAIDETSEQQQQQKGEYQCHNENDKFSQQNAKAV